MSASRWINPPTLVGRLVRLEPLTAAHTEGLKAAVRDGELWKLWYTPIPAPEDMEKFVATVGIQPRDPDVTPFAVVDHSGKVLGTTKYLNVDAANRRLEIGGTWYAQSCQRTGVNTECKLLLLTHAFEVLNCIAVEFRTHWMNQASRNAIARLGAKQDGILRQHRIMADGTFRDTVVFSITNSEWPAVKNHLSGLREARR
jgi:RimJ/RimL family protein N-acetyltransferase